MELRSGEPFGVGQKALSGLRGGYVGVLMFGMLGTIVGLSLINPFSIGAGLLLGAQGFHRRPAAGVRQAAGRGEGRHPPLRRRRDLPGGQGVPRAAPAVQRDLRDYYIDRAEETNRSLKDSLTAAEQSARSSQEEQHRRLAEIPKELARLESLHKGAMALIPGAVAPTPREPRLLEAAQ